MCLPVPEDEEEFQNLRKAVKEYGAAMIEYHKAVCCCILSVMVVFFVLL